MLVPAAMPKEFEVPILLILWRRPQTLRRVLEALRPITPRHLYVSGDGPSPLRPGEAGLVAAARNTLDREIDWPCEIRPRFAETNQGCRRAVGGAIKWFFEHVEEGIILEDDCIPHPDFFPYCRELLARFRDNPWVGCVTGNNFQNGQRRGQGSYYFSKYPHCWGWATWRRAWKHYSESFEIWPKWKKSKEWKHFFDNPHERRYWQDLFDGVHLGKIDSWAIPWTASLWKAGCFTATPQVNLVQNVGFGDEATHTKDPEAAQKLSVPVGPLSEIRHPPEEIVNEEADEYVFWNKYFPTSRRERKSFSRRITKNLGSFCKKLKILLQRA